MSNVIKIIKNQIAAQTREKLNTDVYNSQARAVSEQNVITGDPSTRPQWSIGRYELERLSAITVGDFTNYSGKINWSLFTGKKAEVRGIVSNENILVGINVMAGDRMLLPISLLVHDGYTRVYYRPHSPDSTSWVKQEEIYGGSNSIVRIPLTVGWTAIIVTHYTPNAEQDIEISSEFMGIGSWFSLDYTAPNVPVWDTVPITPSITEGQVVNILRWEKDERDDTFDTAGHGIYRSMITEVGDTGDYIPNTILNNIAGDNTESNRWFVTSGIDNINSGDKVRLGSAANATSVVSQVYNVKRNPIPNPVFRNSSASWNIYGNGTIKNNKTSFVANNFYYINAQGTNQSHYIESDFISISIGSLYNSVIYYNNNLLNNGEYDLGGYGGVPSRWSFSANVLSAIATKDKMPFMHLSVSGTNDVVARTEDSSLFINGVAASYHVSVMASTPKFNRYHVHIVKNSGATLFSSPTLYSTLGYFDSSFTGGTSGTGWGYARVVSLGTSGITTIDIGPLSIIAEYKNTQAYSDWYDDNYLKRKAIEFGTDHSTLQSGYTISVPFNSGMFQTIATNGYSQESIQHSAAHAIVRKDHRTYMCWRSDKNLSAYVKYYDHNTKIFSSDVALASVDASAYYYPNLAVSNSGTIHVIIGGYNSTMKYYKSTATHTLTFGAEINLNSGTYPRVKINSQGNIYVFYRTSTVDGMAYQKSTNDGITWSTHHFVDYYHQDGWYGGMYSVFGATLYDSVSVYCGGVDIDNSDNIHIILHFLDNYGDKSVSRSVAYAYSTDGITWRNLDGSICGTTTSSDRQPENIRYDKIDKVFTSNYGFDYLGGFPSPGVYTETGGVDRDDYGPYYYTNSESLKVLSSGTVIFSCAKYPVLATFNYRYYLNKPANPCIAYSSGGSWATVDLYNIAGQRCWNRKHLGPLQLHKVGIYDGISLWGVINPSEKLSQYSGEVGAWYVRRDQLSSNLWGFEFLTKESAYGIPMICGVPSCYENPEIILGRLADVHYYNFNPFFATTYATYGDDVVIVRDGIALDRITNNYWNHKDTNVDFKLPTTINKNEDPSGYYVYFDNSSPNPVRRNLSNIYRLYESFEDYSTVPSQYPWYVSSTSASDIKIMKSYGDTNSNTIKIHSGENVIEFSSPNITLSRVFPTYSSEAEVNISFYKQGDFNDDDLHIGFQSNSNRFEIKIWDSGTYGGVKQYDTVEGSWTTYNPTKKIYSKLNVFNFVFSTQTKVFVDNELVALSTHDWLQGNSINTLFINSGNGTFSGTDSSCIDHVVIKDYVENEPEVVTTETEQKNIYIREYVKYKFYDSGKGQLSDSTEIDVSAGPYVSGQHAVISTSLNANVPVPTAASFMKISYHNDMTSISTPLSIDSKVFGFMMAADSDHYNKSVFATEMDWVRTDSDLFTKSTPLDQALYLDQEELIYERSIQGSDANVIAWTDYDIIMKSEYAYRLDAYDNSQLKNRSTKSAIATIISGDLTPPKAPSNYIINVVPGVMEHSWTNPTAVDMRLGHIRCYNTSTTATTDIIWEKEVYSPNVSDSYPEVIATTGLQYRYLTAIDRYGNESINYAYATAQAVAGDFVIVDIFFKDTNGDPLDTVNGWFNEDVTASVIAESLLGNPVTSLQINISNYDPVSWQGWLDVGYNTFTSEMKMRVRGRAKDAIKGTWGYTGLDGIPIRLDKDGPTISDNKALINHEKSIGGDGYIVLKWDNSLISDPLSGHYKTAIMRAKASSMLPNPSFEEAKSSTDKSPLGWTGSSSEIYGSDHCNENYSVKVHSDSIIQSPNFNVNNGDNLYVSVKYKGAGLLWMLGTGSGGGHSDSGTNTSGYWDQLEYNFTTGAGYVYITLKDNGADVAYYDEISCVVNPVFSTIGEVLANNSIFIDKDVNPFEYYLYYLAPVDTAGNIGDVSHYKYLRSFTTYRDKWRNMIRNSSFEKTYEVGGKIKAEGWDKYFFTDAFGTFSASINNYEISSGENSYHGLNYFVTSDANDVIFQNKIHILPYANRYRRFVVSFYAKTPSSSGYHNSKLGLSMLSNNMTALKTKNVTVYTADSTDWHRTTATFIVNDFDATNFRVMVQGASSETVYWDAIQLEEKYDLPPTDYYDADVMTLEHLQANLVRAYNIEAENIWAEHIIAGAIHADHISANSITATHIKAGSITATHIRADTITTNELKLADADIFLKTQEPLRIEIWGQHEYPIHATMYGRVSLAFAGVSNQGVIFNAAGIALRNRLDDYVRSTAGTVFIGRISDTFHKKHFIDYPKFNSSLGTAQEVIIARPFPLDLSQNALMILTKGLTKLYTSYCPLSSSPFAEPNYWSTPVYRYNTLYSYPANCLKYYDSYYYLGFKTSGNGYTVEKLTNTGVFNSVTFSDTSISSSYFDISSSGTLLFAKTKTTGGGATIYCRPYNINSSSWGDSFEIATYSGHDINIMPGISKADLDTVDGVYVSYATINKYILTYTLENSKYIFYKVIDSSGNIFVNQDIDVPFMTADASVGGDKIDVGSTNSHSFFRGHMNRCYYNTLFYISAGCRMDMLGQVGERGFPLGGKGFYFKRIDPLISIEDLFNKLD